MGTGKSRELEIAREDFRLRFRDVVLWLLGRRRRFRVSGHSMEPLLHEGDVVFMQPCSRGDVRAGDVVIARKKGEGILVVKRVKRIESNRVFLAGTGVEHDIGWVKSTYLAGVLTSIV